MAGFGETLQRERKLRGISLEEIAGATRIGQHFLAALEGEQFSELPGGIFNRSFVRAYAAYLGLNEGEIVQEFLRVSGDGGELPLPNPPAQKRKRRWRVRTQHLVWTCVVVMLGAAGWGGLRLWQAQHGTVSRVAAPRAGVAATRAPAPAAATRPAAAGVPGVAGASPLTVEIRAIGDSAWVSAAADGKPVLEDTLAAGDTRSFHAANEFDLITGNAAATGVAVNGRMQPPLGAAGQVVHYHYPPPAETAAVPR